MWVGLAVMSLTGALVAGVGTGSAVAGGHPSVTGTDVKTAIATAEFSARNTGGSDYDVKGDFRGGATSPATALLDLQGPITCLHVDGNKAGFLYPIEKNSMPAALKGQYILITVEDGGAGGTDHMGFTGPAPEAAFPDCKPQIAPLEVTSGDIEVKENG